MGWIFSLNNHHFCFYYFHIKLLSECLYNFVCLYMSVLESCRPHCLTYRAVSTFCRRGLWADYHIERRIGHCRSPSGGRTSCWMDPHSAVLSWMNRTNTSTRYLKTIPPNIKHLYRLHSHSSETRFFYGHPSIFIFSVHHAQISFAFMLGCYDKYIL